MQQEAIDIGTSHKRHRLHFFSMFWDLNVAELWLIKSTAQEAMSKYTIEKVSLDPAPGQNYPYLKSR
jgi:hypothetical protein